MSGTVWRESPRELKKRGASPGPGILFKVFFPLSWGKNKTIKEVETHRSTPQSWQLSFGRHSISYQHQ